MKDLLVINSLGGEMKTRRVCPKVNLNIRGVEFLLNLIVLGSKGIYIIFGMDWLTRHKGVIDCATKSIQLTHPDGRRVVYKSTNEIVDKIQLNQAKAVEEIKIVNEFPDVFPEKLPGMPPDRDIEFVIELVPSTAPI